MHVSQSASQSIAYLIDMGAVLAAGTALRWRVCAVYDRHARASRERESEARERRGARGAERKSAGAGESAVSSREHRFSGSLREVADEAAVPRVRDTINR